MIMSHGGRESCETCIIAYYTEHLRDRTYRSNNNNDHRVGGKQTSCLPRLLSDYCSNQNYLETFSSSSRSCQRCSGGIKFDFAAPDDVL